MWRLNIAIVLLLSTLQVHAQIGNGYNYNKPETPFGGSPTGSGTIQGGPGPAQIQPTQQGPSGFPSGPSGSGPQGAGFDSTGRDDGSYDEGDYSAIPGTPDLDYPILSAIPETSFRCDAQQFPGYYADVETRCQVFHVCANNKTYDFLCPNGTIFHQEYLVCVWWNQFDCNTAISLYGINANIYDYSIAGAQQQGGFTGNDQGLTGPIGPIPSFPVGQQAPSAPSGYPGQQGYVSPRPQGLPTQDLPLAPFASYPSGPSGQQGQVPAGIPGSQVAPQQPTGTFQGYRSDRPVPGFPGGQQGTQGTQPRPQQPPTREYLPPVNG